MRSQTEKTLYYATFGKLSILSFSWYRFVNRDRFRGRYLNVGCGPKYVEGMVNIDGNILRRKDIWLDVSLGLPFPGDSVSGIYASHVLEHFKVDKVRRLFKEFYRVLKPGGALRIVVPSLEYAIEAYSAGEIEKFPDWPEKHRSIGGRFNNLMLCANQHFVMFDFSLMEELLWEAGFREVYREQAHSSRCFSSDHMIFESDPALKMRSLYVESFKEDPNQKGVKRLESAVKRTWHRGA